MPPNELDRAVAVVTNQLSSLSASASKVNKKGYLIGMRDWQTAVAEIEELYFEELMNLDDPHEGLNAFVEKREPVWKNK